MFRRLALALLAALSVLILVGAIATARLIYQPVKTDTLIGQRYKAALAQDPAHAALYTQAYSAYVQFTRANSLHYIIHRVAAAAAAITGHAQAAAVQERRARFHRPEHGGALASLVIEIGDGVHRVWNRLT